MGASDATRSYTAGAEAIRDVSKWLVALVPGAGSIIVLGELVPKVAAARLSQVDAVRVGWLASLGLSGVVLLVVMAVRVLRPFSRVSELDKAAAGDGKKEVIRWVKAVDEDGIPLLLGYRDLRGLYRGLEGPEAERTTAADALQAVVEVIDYKRARHRFVQFLWVGPVALALVVGSAFGIEYIVASAPEPVTEPIEVRLRSRTGHVIGDCEVSADEDVEGLAVDGTLFRPLVIVRTPADCAGERLQVADDSWLVIPEP